MVMHQSGDVYLFNLGLWRNRTEVFRIEFYFWEGKKNKHLCFAIKNAETQLNLAEFCLLCIQKQELGLHYFHVCARG